MLDTDAIRRDFPILHQQVNGHPLVYLDSAATSQKPRQVIDALVRYYENDNANINRGVHTLGTRATDAYEAVRSKVARHIGLGPGDAGTVVFTRNTTEAINLVARAWGEANVREGDEIILTEMEHHSNIVPWQLLAARSGARLHFAPVTGDGHLDLDALRALIGPRTRLVSLTHVSNVLGTINPVADVVAMAHAAGALVLADGAQAVPHLPVDVPGLGCDFYAFSAHKMLGPTGVGVLWARREVLDAMPPFLGGGDMIARVLPEGSTWAELPNKFEAGTPNIADVVAFGAALDYLAAIGMPAIAAHERELLARAVDKLSQVEGLTIHGPRAIEERSGVVSFAIDGLHPHDIATIADQRGVAIRASHHCAQILMRRLGEPATSRASFALYNTPGEIEALVAALGDARRLIGREPQGVAR